MKKFSLNNLVNDKDLKSFEDKIVEISGSVVNFKHMTSKKGNQFGEFMFSSEGHEHTFYLFGDDYAQFKDQIQTGLNCVLVGIIRKKWKTEMPELFEFKLNELITVKSQNPENSIHHISNSMAYIVNELDEKRKSPIGLLGIPSGFSNIDYITTGWKHSNLILVAARPGMGKTSFATSVLLEVTTAFRTPVAYLSSSLSGEVLSQRLVSSRGRIKKDKLTSGKLDEDDWKKIQKAADDLSIHPIFILDTSFSSLLDLRKAIWKLKREEEIELLIIDDLDSLSKSLPSKCRETHGKLLTELKQLAIEEKIAILLLIDLDQTVEYRGGDKRPQLADLGIAERHGDMVIFLYRPEYYGLDTDEEGNPLEGLCEVIIEKHKNGRTGATWLKFDLDYLSLSQTTRELQ